MLENSSAGQGQENYPPFDLIKLGDNDYRIELAVAGFKPDEIDITAQQNVLIVSGKKSEEIEDRGLGLHLSRHRDPFVRAPLRAGRPYPGARRGPEGRPARDRAGARDPRGDEAAEDRASAERAQERSAIGGGEQPASRQTVDAEAENA